MTFANLLPLRPILAGLMSLVLATAAIAQSTAPPAESAPQVAPVVVAPPAATGVPALPPVAPPTATPPTVVTPPDASGDASGAKAIDVPARPVALLRGSAKWDDGFAAITGAFTKINAEITKAGLVAKDHPLTVFTETDDTSFRFEAMVPLVEAPAGKDALSDDVKIGLSPAGKAIKFQHRAAYEEIDATYEAITAFLDEKGLEAQNLFIEEYLTDPKSASDPSLEVDIYVFVK